MALQRRRRLLAILPAIWLAQGVLAADDENEITYPDISNLTFHYLDTIDVSYTTNYDTPWIYLWCLDSAGSRQGATSWKPQSWCGMQHH